MNGDIFTFLSSLFLFKNVSPEALTIITSNARFEIKKYNCKQKIYTPYEYEHKIGFIMCGECLVERIKADGNTVPLNTLKKGDSFGILTILSNEESFPTRISAKKSSEILFISKNDTLDIIRNHPEIAMNVISFLSSKINFLNKKIATFSSDSVEEKLSNYLILEYKRHASLQFTFNCKKSAEEISAGRASLYRAISSLTNDGIIKLENKKIHILDPDGLERKTK